MREFLFVSCSRGRKEGSNLLRSLQSLGAENVRFFENNEIGLSIRYNSVLDERAGCDEIVVFVHDDVTIGDIFLREKLFDTFKTQGYTIVGLAGSSEFTTKPEAHMTTWRQPPDYAWSGAVEHDRPGGLKDMTAYGPTPRRCVVLDGLFLAVDMTRIGRVRFDEQFAFHFYDLDFCLTAHCAGLLLGTMGIYVTHRSSGGYLSKAYNEAEQRFHEKWGTRHYEVGLSTPSP